MKCKNLLWVPIAVLAYFPLSNLHAQFDDIAKNRLKFEIEPGLFFNDGRSVNALYNITADNNLSAGIYLMATDIPDNIAKNIFNNYNDSMSAQLTTEFAINFRYRIRLSKNMESNPYVGLLFGWENIRLSQPGYTESDFSTFLITPHVGYEFYVYKKILYINPQLRLAFYVGQQKSENTRQESFKSYLILPSISLGVRI